MAKRPIFHVNYTHFILLGNKFPDYIFYIRPFFHQNNKIMKKHILLIAFMSFFYSITNSQTPADVYGLLTPIRLTETTTEVLLEDYFMDVNRIERVEVGTL
jgi:hypothetical protein